jgi:hypothetical protein
MGQASGCARFDEDTARGGFVATSTIPGNDGQVFYDYQEMYHLLERVKAGHFDAVHDRARTMAPKFGPDELTPLTAEHAARDYTQAPAAA